MSFECVCAVHRCPIHLFHLLNLRNGFNDILKTAATHNHLHRRLVKLKIIFGVVCVFLFFSFSVVAVATVSVGLRVILLPLLPLSVALSYCMSLCYFAVHTKSMLVLVVPLWNLSWILIKWIAPWATTSKFGWFARISVVVRVRKPGSTRC